MRRRAVAWHDGAAAAALVALATFASPTRADDLERDGCTKDSDCKDGRICAARRCVDPQEEPGPKPQAPEPSAPSGAIEAVSAAPRISDSRSADAPLIASEAPQTATGASVPAWQRINLGAYYLAAPPIGGALASSENTQSFGLELGVRVARDLRYELALGVQTASKDGLVLGGVRVDPLGFGYRFTPLSRASFELGIEPAIHLLSAEVYAANAGPWSVFSTSAAVSLVLAMPTSASSAGSRPGPVGDAGRGFYLRLEPLGVDLRWLFVGTGQPSVAGAGLQWRLAASAGWLFGAAHPRLESASREPAAKTSAVLEE